MLAKVKSNIILPQGTLKAGEMLQVRSVNMIDGKVEVTSPFDPNDVIVLATEAVTLIQVLKNAWAAVKVFAEHIAQLFKKKH